VSNGGEPIPHDGGDIPAGRVYPGKRDAAGGGYCGPFRDSPDSKRWYGGGWWFDKPGNFGYVQYVLETFWWLGDDGEVHTGSSKLQPNGLPTVDHGASGQGRGNFYPSQGSGGMTDAAGSGAGALSEPRNAQLLLDQWSKWCNPTPPAGVKWMEKLSEFWSYRVDLDTGKVEGFYYWYTDIIVNMYVQPPAISVDNNGDTSGGNSNTPSFNSF
jgi:hypothetical protein